MSSSLICRAHLATHVVTNSFVLLYRIDCGQGTPNLRKTSPTDLPMCTASWLACYPWQSPMSLHRWFQFLDSDSIYKKGQILNISAREERFYRCKIDEPSDKSDGQCVVILEETNMINECSQIPAYVSSSGPEAYLRLKVPLNLATEQEKVCDVHALGLEVRNANIQMFFVLVTPAALSGAYGILRSNKEPNPT